LLLLTLLPALAATAAEPVIRVGVYENPPKLLMGEDGLPSGIHGDLLREIAQGEGWRLRAVHCEWEECLSALGTGSIDLMPDVAYSDSRSLQQEPPAGFPSDTGPAQLVANLPS